MRTDPGRCYPGREVGPGGHSGEVIVVTGDNRVAFVSCLKGFGYESKLLTDFRPTRGEDSRRFFTTLLYKVVARFSVYAKRKWHSRNVDLFFY